MFRPTRSLRRAAVAAAWLAAASTAPALAAGPDKFAVPGLEKPATVLIDRWGVPHIYANTLYDAFFVQGFVAARDRLFQIDLWRKRGLGEMAKDFGPAYVEGDRMARAVLFRGDMYREWLAYGSDAKRVAEAFVAGVNAYIAQTEAHPELLPPEFKLINYKPSRWRAEDIVRIRHHGLTLNLTGEIDRAQIFCYAKPNAVRADWVRRELDPQIEPKVPDGLDPCTVPAAELRKAYELATAAPRFPKDVWQSGTRAENIPVDQLYATVDASSDTARSLGSNNWVIAGSRTVTGRPILANDPHRAHGAPSLRYISHLNAPGLSVIGAGEPFLPGISIGHNGTIAFGLTRFYMDQEDLYAYETDPAQPHEYKYKGRWEPMETVTEQIAVRGEATPRKVTIDFTRHGPVLYADTKNNRAWALRAAWLDLGMAPYFGSMDYMRAQNWDQFRAAMNRWGAPGENQVYADRFGNIGWLPGGLTVNRPNWDGLMPVPGDGRYEWAGYRNMDELPWAFNPAPGFVVTANENTIPPNHPAAKLGVGYEWAESSRARRLRALVSANPRSSVEDSMAWQNDTVSLPAQRMVTLLKPLTSSDAQIQRGLDLLRGWDGNERADSAPAALFEIWFSKHLRTAVVRAALAPEAARLVGAGDPSRVIAVLERPDSWMSVEKRNDVMLASLKSAMVEVEKKLGPDPKTWQWGKLHTAVFEHPLHAILDAQQRQQFDVNAGPIGGSSFTPMNTSYRNSDFQLTAGASFRMVVDVGNWDASRVVNTPGQSGNPANPHYRDLAPLWAKGEYFPLLYSRKAVEKESKERLELVPQ
ncbi:penicillin acylase family protein [Cupriavidus metallidurans]|uniref:penicillin acylase family protein n=1 Tax=Cupriavidus metallidurans TaxID=119219 RepID=UPI001BFCCD9B|nr:penicillin acylase family protein [Cupriavidus metallidurans]QWC91712.1 penicillin acylase family protein [Cupriavidus metallidurans]